MFRTYWHKGIPLSFLQASLQCKGCGTTCEGKWHTLWRIWCCKLRKQCKLRMADSSPKRSSNHPHLHPVCHSERCGHCGYIPMRRHKLSDTTGACQAGWVIFNHSKRDFREGLHEGCVHVRCECHVRRVQCFVDLSEYRNVSTQCHTCRNVLCYSCRAIYIDTLVFAAG